MRFTKEEDQILRELYGKRTPVKEIASILGRKPNAIKSRASYIKIKNGYFFSKEEDEKLKQLYSILTTKQQ